MATKKKAAKPAKKTATVKKIVPAKKAATKPVQSSGSSKSAKKAPVTKSIAKPVAKKVAPSSSVVRQKNPYLCHLKNPLYPIYPNPLLLRSPRRSQPLLVKTSQQLFQVTANCFRNSIQARLPRLLPLNRSLRPLLHLHR